MLVMSCVMFACKALINRKYIRPNRIAASTTAHKQDSRSSSPEQQEQQQDTNTTSHNPGHDTSSRSSRRKPRQKASWDEAKAVLQQNPKAAALTTWVVSFGIALRLCEYCFKSQLRTAAADSAAYCCALADVNSGVGVATIAMMLSSKLIFKV